MNLNWNGERYEANAEYADRMIPKAAGFRWDGRAKQWWTKDHDKANLLIEHANEDTASHINGALERREASIVDSKATDANVTIPAPSGLDYLPYQRAGIAFASKRPSSLIADEMGLGKTIQAIGVANADFSVSKILVICPASLKLNWKRELEKWLTRPLDIGVADARNWPNTDVVIVNYDVLKKLHSQLRAAEWDLMIVDEAHYIKNAKAQRSKEVLGGGKGTRKVEPIKAKRRVFLTGTPIVNRPIELWPLAHSLDPNEFDNFFGYAKRYSNATHNGFGWDFSGASNLDELQDRLRSTIMVRRLKKDVLTELPAKVRQVIELPANGMTRAIAAERAKWEASKEKLAELRAAVELAKASDNPADYDNAVEALRDAEKAEFTEMARLRHETARAKVPYVIEHIRDAMDGGKVVVMAHHVDVVEAIQREFQDCSVAVTGGVAIEDRQAAVDAFQNDPRVTLFIGNIQAAGVGLTLTASSHVIFAELDWVPGNVTQAEDRCHRIGQHDSVLVQHLVLEGSIDAHLAKTIVRKQNVIDQALDNETNRDERLAAEREQGTEAVLSAAQGQQEEERQATTRNVKRSALRDEGEAMTPEQIQAVHENLRTVAAFDADRARAINGVGFNKIDTMIGCDLAERDSLSPAQAALGRKIVKKYKRQIGEDAVDKMF